LASTLTARTRLRIRNEIRPRRHIDWPRILHFRSGCAEKWAAHESDDVNLSGGKYTKLCHPLLYLDHRQSFFFGGIFTSKKYF